MLSIEEVDTLEKLEALRDVWTNLIKDCGVENLFSTFDFVYAWWKHRSFGNRLFTLIIREDSRVVGIAPLMMSDVKWFGFRVRKVSLLFRILVSDFIIEQSRKEECIRLFIKYAFEKSHCHYIQLCGIRSESPTVQIIKNITKEMGVSFRVDVHSKECFIPLQGTWDSFIRGKSKNFRKRCRKSINRLNRSGQPKVVRVRKSANIGTEIERVLEIESRSWKAKWISEKENSGLVTELIQRCNDNGWLDLWFLELESTPIAYWFNILYGNKAYAMFTTYNGDYAAQSPGFVILYYVINQLFSENKDLREIDFLNELPYLRRWTEFERDRVQVTLYNRGFISQLVGFGRSIIHFARQLRKSKHFFLNE